MKKTNNEVLSDILMFALRDHRRTKGITKLEFLKNDVIQDAVLYALGQMGEKANKLDEAFIEKHSNIEWHSLIGLRNRMYHSYEDISLDFIFDICQVNIPKLVSALHEIME